MPSGFEGWISLFEDDWHGGSSYFNPQPLFVDQESLTFGQDQHDRGPVVLENRVPRIGNNIHRAAKPKGGIAYQFRSSDILMALYAHFQLGTMTIDTSPYRYIFYPRKNPLDWDQRGPYPVGAYGHGTGQVFSVSAMKKLFGVDGVYYVTDNGLGSALLPSAFHFQHGICDKLTLGLGANEDTKIGANFLFRHMGTGSVVNANPGGTDIGTYAETPSFQYWAATVAFPQEPNGELNAPPEIPVSSFRFVSDNRAQENSNVTQLNPVNYQYGGYSLRGEFSFDLPQDAWTQIGSFFTGSAFSFGATLYNGTADSVTIYMPNCMRAPFDYTNEGGESAWKGKIPFVAFEGPLGEAPVSITVDTEHQFHPFNMFGDAVLGTRNLANHATYTADLGARTLSEYTYYSRD